MRTTLMCLQLVAVFAIALSSSGEAAPIDAAARGLDLFVHAPGECASGGTLPVQVRVYGFPTISTLAPLAGAQVEAVWDPESLGEHASSVPPAVTGITDEAGRAHLDVSVPSGMGKLNLLVSGRWHDHERTRSIEITRSKRHALELRVSDTSVVPGGAVSTWVRLRDLVSGRPVAHAAVDLELKEGTVTRFSRRLTTDGAGTAAAQVRVPFTEDPDETWRLTARTAMGGMDEAEDSCPLSVREEKPQAPSLKVRWTAESATPGTRASFEIQALAGGQGISSLPLRYWVGQRGIHPPKDDPAWLRASTPITTDAVGKVTVAVDTPRTISPRGSDLTVLAKALVEGHPLSGQSTLALETPKPTLDVVPEFGVLLPGQAQRLFLHAKLGDQPLSADFALEGHGLSARLHTNDRGWGEVRWNLPREVGATFPEKAQSGCAGEVAATLRIRLVSSVPGILRLDPFEQCLQVDRDAVGIVRTTQPLVRAGDPLSVRIVGSKSPASLVLQGPQATASISAWIADAARGGTVTVPPLAQGLWSVSAAGIALATDKKILPASVLVVPRVLPRLQAQVANPDRASPGGTVLLDVDLDDGRGHPLVGSVGAVVFDKFGGSHPHALLALDTRHVLAANLGVVDQDIDAFLDGDPRLEMERWAALTSNQPTALPPQFDPPATVHEETRKVFADIVRSLEGAVFESSTDPERLRDVRIRRASGFALNPEMLTLVTEAMDEPPLTPGGEPWRLADLMAVDAQVNYDHVARRVTRLKLFRVLSVLRDYIHEHNLWPDEPMLRDPNAMLRRLVQQENLESGALLDPWGHSLSFVRATGPRIPFISVIPGFRLQSAGPDGRFGTADDVQDPFQRVLASKTPYANAVEEDRLVDAKWDMKVGDETVEAWKTTLEELTGTNGAGGGGEGSGYGGLGSLGSGGGGSGYGKGRGSSGIDPGPAQWLSPVRTDERGHVRLTVPLGDAETTWQIVLVAMPDQASPATTSVDVPIALPLSVRVNTGATWIEGDEVDVAMTLRNRTQAPLSAALQVSASGAAQLADARSAQRTLQLPAQSVTTELVRVRGIRMGTGVLTASLTAPGTTDRVHHQWTIKPAGEVYLASNAIALEQAATLALPAATEKNPAMGPARLILEQGLAPVLATALESLLPEHLTDLRSFAEAQEIFGRVQAWAQVHVGNQSPLGVRARELARQVGVRVDQVAKLGRDRDSPLYKRAKLWQPEDSSSDSARKTRARADCPPSADMAIEARFDWLEVAPPSGRANSCWAAFLAATLQHLAGSNEPLLLARATMALQEWPSQTMATSALAERLRAAVPVQSDGTLELPTALADDRADRSMVMAALVRTRGLGKIDASTVDRIAKLGARLYAGRDAHGGYGSPLATRLVVRTLLDAEPVSFAPAVVRWTELSSAGRPLAQGSVNLAGTGTSTLTLSPATTQVRLEPSSPSVIARTIRPLFRSFLQPPDPASSPLHVTIAIPKSSMAEGRASLQVGLRHDLNRPISVRVRIPLPPGASLAEPVTDIRQVQGALYIRTTLADDPLTKIIEVPLRLALSGVVTIPEVTVRTDDSDIAPARAPALPIVISPKR